MQIGKLFRELLSEPGTGGTLSWGRVASAAAFIASIAWVSGVLYHTGWHTLPSLEGVTSFVVGPYAANKAGAAVQSFTSNPIKP